MPSGTAVSKLFHTGSTANISGFANHTVSVATTQVCFYCTDAAVEIMNDNMQNVMNEYGCVSIRHYLQKDTAGWIAISCFTWENQQVSVGVRI